MPFNFILVGIDLNMSCRQRCRRRIISIVVMARWPWNRKRYTISEYMRWPSMMLYPFLSNSAMTMMERVWELRCRQDSSA